MATADVLITRPEAVPPGLGSRWIYFGKSSTAYRGLIRRLGASSLPTGAELIDEVAFKIRLPFTELDRCLALDDRLLEWDASTVAERSPYTSELFYGCCVAVAFVRLLQAGGPLTVFVEDGLLAAELARQARLHGTTVTHRPPLRQRLAHRVLPAAAIVRGVLARGRLVLELARRRRFLRGLDPPPEGPLDVLLVTWASPRSFRAGEPIEGDTYFGELPALLRAAGLKVGYLANPLSWVHPWREIAVNARSAGEPVLLPEDCVRTAAAVRLAWRSLRRRFRVVRPFLLEGVDLTPLLRHELLRELSNPRQTWALQFAAAAGRLARTRARVVIHPFENQAWEKTLRTGLSELGVFCIGYQHAPFALLWLPYFPSSADLRRGALPDRVVTIGRRWTELFVAHGYPTARVRDGAAFRFATAAGAAVVDGGASRTVVVAAPIAEAEAFELLLMVVGMTAPDARRRLLIKLHPAMGGGDLIGRVCAEQGLTGLPEGVRVADEPLGELLIGAGALVYSGTSSCFEALALGVPVVSVRTPLWLDLDPLPPDFAAGLRVHTPEELAAALETLWSESTGAARERRARGIELARATLASVDATGGVAPFLDGTPR